MLVVDANPAIPVPLAPPPNVGRPDGAPEWRVDGAGTISGAGTWNDVLGGAMPFGSTAPPGTPAVMLARAPNPGPAAAAADELLDAVVIVDATECDTILLLVAADGKPSTDIPAVVLGAYSDDPIPIPGGVLEWLGGPLP